MGTLVSSMSFAAGGAAGGVGAVARRGDRSYPCKGRAANGGSPGCAGACGQLSTGGMARASEGAEQ